MSHHDRFSRVTAQLSIVLNQTGKMLNDNWFSPELSQFYISAVLDSTSPTSSDGQRIRREIWEFSLLDVLILVFKHDYSIIEGQWMTAARLTTIFRLE